MHVPMNQIQYSPNDFACLNNAGSTSTPLKRSSPKRKRKSQTAAVSGGRVVRVAGRKDRHSKVYTAKGLRDRRVRLAPTTAIPFYDVLDRLGFDRPSKALDWLLNKAKTAIDALAIGQQQTTTLKFCDSTAPECSLSLSQHGMREEHQPSNDGACLFSGFSCFVDAPPPSAAAYLDPNGFCSTPPILETNWEKARLPNLFTWNSVNESSRHASGGGGGAGADYFSWNSLPPYAAEQPILGHRNLGWEPLQSSNINYASSINDAFPEFCDELWKIAEF